MASKELQVLLTLKDEASKQLSTIGNKIEDLSPNFKKMALIGTASFGAISVALKSMVDGSKENEAVQNRLAHILKTATNATDKQVASLYKQAEALENLGVVSAEGVMTAQSQLATFDLQQESIEKLIPSILDYAVAERGAGVGAEELRGLTNGLAQALQGNFASLTKTGFVLDETTKELIKNGTEAERTSALVDVLNSTYEGFNAKARETTEGSLIVLNNEIGKLKDSIGDLLLPVIREFVASITPVLARITAWVEANPELTKNIIIVSLALSGFVAILGTLGLIIPSVIAGLGLVAGALSSPLLLPIVSIVAILGGLIALLVSLRQWFIDLFMSIEEKMNLLNMFQLAWQSIITIFNEMLLPTLTNLWNKLQPFLPLLEMMAKVIGVALVVAIGLLLAGIVALITGGLVILNGAFMAVNAVIDAFAWGLDNGIKLVKSMIEWVQQLIDKLNAFKALQSAVSFVSNVFGGGKAVGGNVSGNKPYMVGERGPEMFVPSGNGRIIPNSGLGGGGVTVNINGGNFIGDSMENLANALSENIMSKLSLNNRMSD